MVKYIYWQSLLDIILIILMLKGWSNVFFNSDKRKTQRNQYCIVYGILLALLGIFGGLGWDYYSYENIFYNYNRTGTEAHIEPIYYAIYNFCPNYLCWRILVWGSSSAIMMWTLVRIKSTNYAAFIFTTIFYALSFYALRSSLGVAIFFLGYTYLYFPLVRKKLLSIILGLGLIAFSFFFHKSMILPIVLAVVLYVVPLNRTIYIASLVLYPILFTATTLFIDYILGTAFNVENTELKLALAGVESYTSKENIESTVIGKISNFFAYFPFYASILVLTYRIIIKKIEVPRYIKELTWYTYSVAYVAALFFYRDVSFWLFIRFLTYGYFSMAIILGYFYTRYKATTFWRIILVIATISTLFSCYYTFRSHFP